MQTFDLKRLFQIIWEEQRRAYYEDNRPTRKLQLIDLIHDTEEAEHQEWLDNFIG